SASRNRTPTGRRAEAPVLKSFLPSWASPSSPFLSAQRSGLDRNFGKHCGNNAPAKKTGNLMTDVSNPPRVRSRWPLFVMPGLLVILAIGWTAFWFYASSQVGAQFDRWRLREV